MESVSQRVNELDWIAKVKSQTSLIETTFEPASGVLWCKFAQHAPAKFSPELLSGLCNIQRDIMEHARLDLQLGRKNEIRYQVLSSNIPGVFSFGGDLQHFRSLILEKDRAGLLRYGKTCMDLVYWNAVNYKLPITTIALVQGGALGGGFEAVLSANVIVAERQSKMGFPEILFNMFPGMGAYPLLARRIPPVHAERMIQSCRMYGAEELYEKGLVDILADEGQGEEAVISYIRAHGRHWRGNNALRRAVQISAPIRYEDLMEVVGIWVEAALSMEKRDLEIMQRLADAQQTEYEPQVTSLYQRVS